jgi:hypothetical protein
MIMHLLHILRSLPMAKLLKLITGADMLGKLHSSVLNSQFAFVSDDTKYIFDAFGENFLK